MTNDQVSMTNAQMGIVARELLRDAARMHRWSQHRQTDGDLQHAETRAAGAAIKARAAFRLYGTTQTFSEEAP